MITFQELREKKLKGMPPGEHVFDKKMKGVSVMIHKTDAGMYCLYLDNEKLDEYPTLARAKKSAEEFVKAAKEKQMVDITQKYARELDISNPMGIPAYDFILNAYTGTNITSTTYKRGGTNGTSVAVVSYTYDGSDNLLTVTRSS